MIWNLWVEDLLLMFVVSALTVLQCVINYCEDDYYLPHVFSTGASFLDYQISVLFRDVKIVKRKWRDFASFHVLFER